MKFAPADLVRNVRTSEDGKVIEAYQDKGAARYIGMGSQGFRRLEFRRQGRVLVRGQLGFFHERVIA
jgi:hypothetical protein